MQGKLLNFGLYIDVQGIEGRFVTLKYLFGLASRFLVRNLNQWYFLNKTS